MRAISSIIILSSGWLTSICSTGRACCRCTCRACRGCTVPELGIFKFFITTEPVTRLANENLHVCCHPRPPFFISKLASTASTHQNILRLVDVDLLYEYSHKKMQNSHSAYILYCPWFNVVVDLGFPTPEWLLKHFPGAAPCLPKDLGVAPSVRLLFGALGRHRVSASCQRK